MEKLPELLRDNVRLLGEVLGEMILAQHGRALFDKVEEIRGLSKALAQRGEEDAEPDYQPLREALARLGDADILPVSRAFNQFLNLANIADQDYFYGPGARRRDALAEQLQALIRHHGAQRVKDLLAELRIELVLTAHPTETTRRTLIHKYEKIAHALAARRRGDLLIHEAGREEEALRRTVQEIWHSDEIRAARPSAVDEAKWGFAVIENSLWKSLPDLLRHLDALCRAPLGAALPLTLCPFRLFSWMGGDRDGNPNVTGEVTREVLLLGRWKAADLCLRDVQGLIDDLSMHEASDELLAALERPGPTPYRDLLHRLRSRLLATLRWAEAALGKGPLEEPAGIVHCRDDLLAPLLLCHRSLLDQGLREVAAGPLTDLIRRICAFGINLLPLDIRQDGERHSALLDELTAWLDLGRYSEWDEARRQDFLLEELAGRRPLVPRRWDASDEAMEVLESCRVIAAQPRELLSHYVISMARQPSDVLAVALLLKECGMRWKMPVAPLFETLDDLERAPEVMERLWNLPWYREYCGGRQTVMIGYSDSAKDAGKFAATWALYRCQERLVELARRLDISLLLFHGRGGSIGRGGGPVEKAMAAQPPGSVPGRIRVTEQGEMIRYKFGMPRVAFSSLGNYLQATLQATLEPAPPPEQRWRDLIGEMAARSLEAYRGIVRGDEHFVDYFRSLTPERELNKLALGSRPARRGSGGGGVESLRAIPWVFAWTQVRLNLPAWLGSCQALDYALEHDPDTLREMLERWPFFSSFIDLLEMVLGKADAAVCAHYEQLLVEPELRPLGRRLRGELLALSERIRRLKGQGELLGGDPLLQQSIAVRKPYLDPLNYLQAELLRRERAAGSISEDLERALKVTMTGIAAGMRNTG